MARIKKIVKKSKLGAILKKKNLTVYRTAKLLKVTQTMVNGWINKYNPSAEYCAKLMVLLNCTIWDLLHQTEEEVITEEDDLEKELEERLKELM